MKTADLQEDTADELESLTDRISRAISRGKFSAAELQAVLKNRSGQVAKKTDDLVHDYAWTAVGIGIGLGFLTGLLAGRGVRDGKAQKLGEELRQREMDRAETTEWNTWDKLQTILPLALLAAKAIQEWRSSRTAGHS